MDIKLYSDPAYSIRVTLDSKSYKLTFRYSTSELAWYMDLDGLSDTTIAVHGIRLAGGVDLLEPYALNDLGELWLIDMSGARSEPTFDTISTNFVLYYVEIA
jgi:hypothetical protein